jgi:hypothetical protein
MTDPTPIDWDDLWRAAHADAKAAAKELPTLRGAADAIYIEHRAIQNLAAAVAARSMAATGSADRAQTVARACGLISSAAQTPSGRAALMYTVDPRPGGDGRAEARSRGLFDHSGRTTLGWEVRNEILRLTTPKETDQ